MNPYRVLGVTRDAGPDELRRALRAVRFREHPDRGGEEERYKAAAEAFALLSDPRERALFDLLDPAVRGDDESAPLLLPVPICLVGGRVRHGPLEVVVPPDVGFGHVLRLAGKGGPGEPPGDLLLTVTPTDGQGWRVEGRDIVHTLEVSWLAALRGDVVHVALEPLKATKIPLPRRCQPLHRLRLVELGLRSGAERGDAILEVLPVTPEPTPQLLAALEERTDGPLPGVEHPT